MASLNRRRFLQITVATSAAVISSLGSLAQASGPTIWRGIVLGAEASIRIYGDQDKAHLAIKAALSVIKEEEAELSIYDPHSCLSQLNEMGALTVTEKRGASVHRLAVQSKAIHQKTNGLFDPTIQPLFKAYAENKGHPTKVRLERAKALVGIDKVETSNSSRLTFRQKGMALTFNGIAQGFMTDKVRRSLDALGYHHALINIGEYSAGTHSAKIGVADAKGDIFDIAVLQNQAIATSSPAGYVFPDGTSHILHPNGRKLRPTWDTVSVVADNAALADGYSTALALAPDITLGKKLVAERILQRIILKDMRGQVHHIG